MAFTHFSAAASVSKYPIWRYNCSLPSGCGSLLVKNVNGFRCGDCGGRMDTGAASRHSVSMKWPVAVWTRSTGPGYDDPAGFVDVISSP